MTQEQLVILTDTLTIRNPYRDGPDQLLVNADWFWSDIVGPESSVGDRPRIPRPNPLQQRILRELSCSVLDSIQDIVGNAVGNQYAMESRPSANGMIFGDGENCRTCTNAECAKWPVSLSIDGDFDASRPLPPQVAKWLISLASKLTKAAEKVKLINDVRDLNEIKRLMTGETSANEIGGGL